MSSGPELASLVGTRIKDVAGKVTGVEPNTKQETFDFFLTLSDGRIVLMQPNCLLLHNSVPEGSQAAKLQIIDGLPSLIGETITDVIVGDRSASGKAFSVADSDGPEPLALVLSSGRAVMNVFKCGGGNVLHTESLAGVEANFGRKWSSVLKKNDRKSLKVGHGSR